MARPTAKPAASLVVALVATTLEVVSKRVDGGQASDTENRVVSGVRYLARVAEKYKRLREGVDDIDRDNEQ